MRRSVVGHDTPAAGKGRLWRESKTSAGILLYRLCAERLEVLLVHPGGPFWATKDEGAWALPKGEFGEDEDPFTAALREETGVSLSGDAVNLGSFRQAACKPVHGFAMSGDLDPARLVSNTFEMEWPPHTGKRQVFPEVDRAAWFTPEEALGKINAARAAFIVALQRRLDADGCD